MRIGQNELRAGFSFVRSCNGKMCSLHKLTEMYFISKFH